MEVASLFNMWLVSGCEQKLYILSLFFQKIADVGIFWDLRLIISKKCMATPIFLSGFQ